MYIQFCSSIMLDKKALNEANTAEPNIRAGQRTKYVRVFMSNVCPRVTCQDKNNRTKA